MTVELITLVSFTGIDDEGYEPEGGLLADANGDLFGTTRLGNIIQNGVRQPGVVFELQNTGTVAAPIYGSATTTLFKFTGDEGTAKPAAGLIADSNGNLFGTTSFGPGAVFELQNIGTIASPAYGDATTLVSFTGNSDGGNPYAGLLADANGDLFGTTYDGGSDDLGVVFELQNTGTIAAPLYGSTPITLVEFNGSNGTHPVAGLIADANGDLFGTASQGGTYNDGMVFELQNTGTVAAPSYSNGATPLYSFGGADGSNPAGLLADANGDLFGTTSSGGASGLGTVFELENFGTVAVPTYVNFLTTLVNFNVVDGANPDPLLIADANGDLFGTTTGSGYGTVFEVKNIGTIVAPIYASAATTLAKFTGGANGAYPQAGLTADANGDLFGTTSGDGTEGGTLFEITGAFMVTAISGTVSGQTTTSEAVVKPFSSVTIADVNANASDTLTITRSNAGAGGTLADGTGFSGLTTVGGGIYTLSGDAAAVTSELDALVFTPVGAPNSSSTTTFTLSDQSDAGGAPAVDSATSVIDSNALSTIAGTVAGITTQGEETVEPFRHVTVGDPNGGATDTLTITLGGVGGTLADAPVFGGLTLVGAGVYSLTGTAAAITDELDFLAFTPTAGTPNSYSTTTFALSDENSSGGGPVVDTTTTVIDRVFAVLPTIAGTVAGQTTTHEAAVLPFAHVTVGDANFGATDQLRIFVNGAGGTLADGPGFSGLTNASVGAYKLTGTANLITSELEALVFAPTAGAPNAPSTTTFRLEFDSDALTAEPAIDSTTTVIDTACFCAGALILTDRGRVAVENLAVGDLVITTDGDAKPISWIGRHKVAARFADRLRCWPVRVKAGALDINVPDRDLLISPDHGLLVEGVLVQAGALVNGTSIVREAMVPTVFTYYHVELDDHSLILVENTPAETFVDNVDRMGFDNWAEHEALYPEGRAISELPIPRAKSQRQVPMHIRAALAQRAEIIGGAERAIA